MDNIILDVNISDLFADDTFNSRGVISPIDVVDLAKSIDRDGLLQPIVVSGLTPEKQKETGCLYRVIAGFRRYTAFKILKKDTIPAIVRNDLTEKTARLLNLTENLGRSNLNVLQEARALLPLRELGMTEQEIVESLPGVSRGWVQIRVMLLRLPSQVQQEASVGNISQTHIRDLYTLQKNGGTEEDVCNQVKRIKESRERAEAIPVERKVTPDKAKRTRKRNDIFNLMGYIRENIGNCFATVCLGWAAGENSDQDIYNEIKLIVESQGKTYIMPKEAL